MTYPYMSGSGKLTEFFQKARNASTPQNVSQQWLAQLGFKSSNHRRIPSVLKALTLIDDSGTPSSKWNEVIRQQDKELLGQMVKDSYSSLFEVISDPRTASDDDLETFFRAETSVGAEAVKQMVSTFRTLCSLAAFVDSKEANNSQDTGRTVRREVDEPPPVQRDHLLPNSSSGSDGNPITLNVNIQLNMPETTNEEVYDKFFASLKRNILDS